MDLKVKGTRGAAGKIRRDFLTPDEAAEIAQVGTGAIYKWAHEYGIGRKIAGHWRIDESKLNKLLAGEIFNDSEKETKKRKK